MAWYEALWGLFAAACVIALFGYMIVALSGCGTKNAVDPICIEAHAHHGFELYSDDGMFDVHYSIAGPGWIGVHGPDGIWEFWQADGSGVITAAVGVPGANDVQVIADSDPVVVYWMRVDD